VEDHRGASFAEADFTGARFRGVNFSKVKISDAWLFDVDLSGLVSNLKVNGVDVTTFVEGELNKRYPERLLLAPSDPDGMRTAWRAVEEFTGATLARAQRLAPQQLDVRVDDEWSYLETLRHLVFATDRWITGPVLNNGEEEFHRLGMPHDNPEEWRGTTIDLDARPTFDEVLAVRNERMQSVARFLAATNNGELTVTVASPNGGTTSVMSCIHVVMNEEWAHDRYANRDLDVLTAS
jgi:DinB family protein/pentapeptide repeat protein